MTIGFGVALIVVALGGYLASYAKTALIPGAEGIILVILGVVALNPAARKHAMHAVAVVALLGFLMAGGRLMAALSAGTAPSGLAAFSLGAMALLSGALLAACINSFIQVRRARRLAPGTPADPSSSTRA